MPRTAVINIVGLTSDLITNDTPFLQHYIKQAVVLPITPVLPAVTTTVQTTYLTGKLPCEHGIVGNGWYSRTDAEVKFWKQSNHLIDCEKVWDVARQRNKQFTVANSFWWYNMYSNVDYSITPRPMYPADGRKIPDVYTQPAHLRDMLQDELGQFPLFKFWGPATSIESSKWIVEAAMKVEDMYQPTLHLIYIPHLDYCLQSKGTEAQDITKDLREVDGIVETLIRHLEGQDVRVMIVSEYAVSKVSKPVHINRALRNLGMISVRKELGKELLDAGGCRAFAVADHQIAHVYINDASAYDETVDMLKKLDGVGEVLEMDGKKKYGINHSRAGDVVVVAEKEAWFTYYYWMNDDVAPDFARCVDIHRKPGYDPVELFVDPGLWFPKIYVGCKVIKKMLGFRYLMDVIPLQPELVVGSHGICDGDLSKGAILITKCKDVMKDMQVVQATEVFQVILRLLAL